MIFFIDMIKGMFIGIANIIPGVSGGTIALTMGIYDKLIHAVSSLFKDWKNSLVTLLPIAMGVVVGLISFTYIIEYLLSSHTFITCMTFTGLILGGLPMIISQLKHNMRKAGRSVGISGVLAFLILFAVAVILPLIGSGNAVLKTFTASPAIITTMFFVGVIASATMVIPGVSGSLVMMILGYYYGILDTIKSFIEALKVYDVPVMINGFLILFPLGIGVLLGIFLISKLINLLFERYGVQTFCAILGLILSSPFAIFYNTGLTGQLKQLNFPIILSGFLLAGASGILAYWLGEK